MSSTVESVVASIARGPASDDVQPNVRAFGVAATQPQFSDHLGTEPFGAEDVSGTFSAAADRALAGEKDLVGAVRNSSKSVSSCGTENDSIRAARAVVIAMPMVREAQLATAIAWPDEERGGVKRSTVGPDVQANADADASEDTSVTPSAPAGLTPGREEERQRYADGIECDARAVALAMPVVRPVQYATAFVWPDEELGGVKRSIQGPDVEANSNANPNEKPTATVEPKAKTLVGVKQEAGEKGSTDVEAKANADAAPIGHGHGHGHGHDETAPLRLRQSVVETSVPPIFFRHAPMSVRVSGNVNATLEARAIPPSTNTTTTIASTTATASSAASTCAPVPALTRAPVPPRNDSAPRVTRASSPRAAATGRDALPASDDAHTAPAAAPLAPPDMLALAAVTAGVLPPPSPAVSGVTTVKTPTVISTAHSDVDATATAIRNAEAVGHRRVLAGDAHGALTLEDLGRFEVYARTRDDGRVEVQVHADRREGAAVLDAHAAELRADVRVEVPRAFIAVQTSPAEPPTGTPTRSDGRETEARDGRTERRAEHADHLASAPTTPAQEASSNRRSGRVRIVL